MIINWSVEDIKNQINSISFNESDPRLTGWETWRCKQDLYEILWHVQDKLKRCSTYTDEKEFVENHEANKILKVLKNES